jgi:hypothetical protein
MASPFFESRSITFAARAHTGGARELAEAQPDAVSAPVTSARTRAVAGDEGIPEPTSP